MAEDIGFEPDFDFVIEEPKQKAPKIENLKLEPVEEKNDENQPEKHVPKSASAKRRFNKKMRKENGEEVAEKKEIVEESNSEPKPMSKTEKKKLKRKLRDERIANGEVLEPTPPKKEKTENEKPKPSFKDKNHSFEAIEQKFQVLLGTLCQTSTCFKEGETIIKKQIEEGKITKEEARTLFRVFNRNLRVRKLRDKLVKMVGEDAPLDQVKERVTIWVNAGKVTRADAGLLVKRFKSREHRRLDRQSDKITSSACFHCREPGHRVVDCPKKNSSHGEGICFKCGSTEHSIHECKKTVKGFPYATCFVCKQIGHISRDCHQNSNGVYPDGGCCNVCGSNAHLKRNCPELAAQKAGGQPKKQFVARAAEVNGSADADYDPTFVEKSAEVPKPAKKTQKHIKF